MHIIASEFQKSRRTVSKTFEVIDLALKYIRDNYLTDVKEDSLAYTRLVTHVKYFAQRYVDNKESMDEDELLDQKAYRKCYIGSMEDRLLCQKKIILYCI